MAILTTQHGSGEEEWEQHLSTALGNHSVRWLHLEGQATTFNWQRVLQPALAPAHSARLAAVPHLPPPPSLGHGCVECALWALFDPSPNPDPNPTSTILDPNPDQVRYGRSSARAARCAPRCEILPWVRARPSCASRRATMLPGYHPHETNANAMLMLNLLAYSLAPSLNARTMYAVLTYLLTVY